MLMDPKILNKIVVNEETGCWEWKGAKTTCGYPVISRGGNTNIRGNRYVYEWVNGKIKEGHVIRHTCDIPLCVNPEHLISGLPSDNVKDMDCRDRRFRTVKKGLVTAVMALWNTETYNKLQIAKLLNVDPRRVGEIVRGDRDDSGRLINRR